jgi:very-short-patch-repair endonuclease
MLTRYALYLLLTHCDPQKPEIALFLAYLVNFILEVGCDYALFAQEMGTLLVDNVALSKEQETIGQIARAFQHRAMTRQYRVDGYFIDLYFPSYRITIECDEYNHVDYSPKEEYQRQKHIEDVLECKFIRYNPDDKNFNIGDVIHEIMLLMYH